jgi:hypothetical protein
MRGLGIFGISGGAAAYGVTQVTNPQALDTGERTGWHRIHSIGVRV